MGAARTRRDQSQSATTALQAERVADLVSRLALAAAHLSHALQPPVVDSIILVTARDQQARLHTMDNDSNGIADVE